MKMFVILARCALVIFCLPRHCDSCLDMLLRSFFDVFNPNLEVGPGRLVSRHRYADGIMPDYPATAAGSDFGGGGIRSRRTGLTGRPVDGRRLRVRGGSSDAKSATEGRPRAKARDSGGDDYSLHSLTDFITSLMQTVQLTPRAALKKAGTSVTAKTAPTTTPTVRFPRVSPAPANA